MPRFVRYEDALASIEGRTRLRCSDLERALDAAPAAAEHFLRRMEAEGVVGPPDADGSYPVLGARRRRWGGPPPIGNPIQSTPDELDRLRQERDAAVQRAAAAEERLAAALARPPRHAVLRRMLARELHPDAAPAADAAERRAQEDIFKRVWPRIERILEDPEEP